MSRVVGTLAIAHSCDCARCGASFEGDTLKLMYLALIIHLRFRCPNLQKAERPKLIKVLWQLWRWKPGKAASR